MGAQAKPPDLRSMRMDYLAGQAVQRSLLPLPDRKFGKYRATQKVLPSLYLSGDFVNYQTALDRYLLFYLTDVSGSGASSALATVVMKQLVSRLVRRHIRENDTEALARAPEGFMECLSKELEESGMEKYLTLFAGSLDMHTNRMRYAIGAHLPAPILASSGRAGFLPGKGPPVGLMPEAHWQIQSRQMPDEFVLWVFSDGILELLPAKTLADKEQMLLAQLCDCPPSADEALKRLNVKEGDAVPDDVAVLMICR